MNVVKKIVGVRTDKNSVWYNLRSQGVSDKIAVNKVISHYPNEIIYEVKRKNEYGK